MNRQGILFRGLPVHGGQKKSFLQEEASYMGKSGYGRKEAKTYMDITYFLLYAMCQNVICRGKVRDIKQERGEYLLRQADKSRYQGEYFWIGLEEEERRCAKLILGLLEEIRNFRDDRAEKAWIGFWYLIHCGFREEYNFLRKISRISVSELCEHVKNQENAAFMGTSRICMLFLLAEETGVKILDDEKNEAFYSCIRAGIQLWEIN